jgi:drug/metabolite transporter (DMT)-like permease
VGFPATDPADQVPLRGAAFGLAAAALFGLSAPLAKLLLPGTGQLAMAGLLYLGGGLGLLIAGRLLRRPAGGPGGRREAALRAGDAGLLLLIIVAGGIVGPALMLIGLGRVSGVVGSLLLNLEAPFTMLLAVAAFREHLAGRALAGSALIVAGAALLGYRPGTLHADPVGVAAIAGACLCWALDNNLTQRLSVRDPVAIVRVKALGAGAASLALAALAGQAFPAPGVAASALIVGFFGYGVSIVLDVYALRLLGAAREAAFFATAPFVGAVAAVPLLGDPVRAADVFAGAVMAAGAATMLRERHSHVHAHEALEHDHLHVHDAHHRHEHEGPVVEPHAHWHRHAPLTHDHPHVPDLHHRHRH